MAADSLLAALQDNYGMAEMVVDDVNTVRGLLGFCKKWTEGLAHPDELNNPCIAMARQLREAAAKMQSDLREASDMAEPMRTPLQRTAEAYLAIAEVLEEFPELARDGNRIDFLDNLDLFEEERQAVLDAQQQMELQLSGQIRVCPRCGSSAESSDCETCLLTRLYPDPGAAKAHPEHERVQGLYGKVFRSYRRVVSGERSLRVLRNALELLEEHLEELLTTRKQLTRRLDGETLTGQRLNEAETMESLLAAAEANVTLALKGIARMKEAEQSFRVHDLSRGWDDIFHAARALEVSATRIRHHLADEDDDNDDESPPRNLDDLTAFSGEE